MWCSWHNTTSLVESDGVEAKAEVEEANGGAVKDAKENHSLRINWFGLKEAEALCNMECAEGHR